MCPDLNFFPSSVARVVVSCFPLALCPFSESAFDNFVWGSHSVDPDLISLGLQFSEHCFHRHPDVVRQRVKRSHDTGYQFEENGEAKQAKRVIRQERKLACQRSVRDASKSRARMWHANAFALAPVFISQSRTMSALTTFAACFCYCDYVAAKLSRRRSSAPAISLASFPTFGDVLRSTTLLSPPLIGTDRRSTTLFLFELVLSLYFDGCASSRDRIALALAGMDAAAASDELIDDVRRCVRFLDIVFHTSDPTLIVSSVQRDCGSFALDVGRKISHVGETLFKYHTHFVHYFSTGQRDPWYFVEWKIRSPRDFSAYLGGPLQEQACANVLLKGSATLLVPRRSEEVRCLDVVCSIKTVFPNLVHGKDYAIAWKWNDPFCRAVLLPTTCFRDLVFGTNLELAVKESLRSKKACAAPHNGASALIRTLLLTTTGDNNYVTQQALRALALFLGFEPGDVFPIASCRQAHDRVLRIALLMCGSTGWAMYDALSDAFLPKSTTPLVWSALETALYPSAPEVVIVGPSRLRFGVPMLVRQEWMSEPIAESFLETYDPDELTGAELSGRMPTDGRYAYRAYRANKPVAASAAGYQFPTADVHVFAAKRTVVKERNGTYHLFLLDTILGCASDIDSRRQFAGSVRAHPSATIPNNMYYACPPATHCAFPEELCLPDETAIADSSLQDQLLAVRIVNLAQFMVLLAAAWNAFRDKNPEKWQRKALSALTAERRNADESAETTCLLPMIDSFFVTAHSRAKMNIDRNVLGGTSSFPRPFADAAPFFAEAVLLSSRLL